MLLEVLRAQVVVADQQVPHAPGPEFGRGRPPQIHLHRLLVPSMSPSEVCQCPVASTASTRISGSRQSGSVSTRTPSTSGPRRSRSPGTCRPAGSHVRQRVTGLLSKASCTSQGFGCARQAPLRRAGQLPPVIVDAQLRYVPHLIELVCLHDPQLTHYPGGKWASKMSLG